MTSKNTPLQFREDPIRLHSRQVKYRWSTPDGSTHHASTVILSRTHAGLRAAFKRFWITNRHVDPDQDSAIGYQEAV